jgi:hypothetical protein
MAEHPYEGRRGEIRKIHRILESGGADWLSAVAGVALGMVRCFPEPRVLVVPNQHIVKEGTRYRYKIQLPLKGNPIWRVLADRKIPVLVLIIPLTRPVQLYELNIGEATLQEIEDYAATIEAEDTLLWGGEGAEEATREEEE